MAVVKPDLITGGSSKFTLRGWEFTRPFMVSGLTGSPDRFTRDAAVAIGIPRLGDSHPVEITAYVFDIVPETIAGQPNTCRVTVFYRQFDEDYEYRIDAGLETRQVTKYFSNQVGDGTLSPMELEYTYPSDYKHEPKVAGLPDTQVPVAEVQGSFPKFIIARNERLTTTVDLENGWAWGIPLDAEIIGDRNKSHASTINSTSWLLRPRDAEGTWLFLGLTANSIDGGLAWRVEYSFTYNKFGHDFRAVFEDPTTGNPIPDPDASSQKEFPQYLFRNFNSFELR